jgi:5'-nucleotidase
MALRFAIIPLLSVVVLVGCSGGSDTISTPQQPSQALTILVTNDDGIGAPGIDALVNGLLELNDVEVKLVAPAENQSGSSDKTTEGDLVSEDSATTSGYSGVAVYGYPADAVNVALEDLDIVPHLVIAGVNLGHNVGPFAVTSGTVGAARTAARAGYPAVAASASYFAEYADYDAAVVLVTNWINDNRDALMGGSASAETVTSFNVPGCTAGKIRELVAVPLAESVPDDELGRWFKTDCSLEPDSPPATDIEALVKGHATVVDVPLELQPLEPSNGASQQR